MGVKNAMVLADWPVARPRTQSDFMVQSMALEGIYSAYGMAIAQKLKRGKECE